MDRRKIVLSVLTEITGKPPEEIREEHDLVADLGIDSPNALRLLVELEEQLGIEITDEQAAEMESVGDILRQLDSAA